MSGRHTVAAAAEATWVADRWEALTFAGYVVVCSTAVLEFHGLNGPMSVVSQTQVVTSPMETTEGGWSAGRLHTSDGGYIRQREAAYRLAINTEQRTTDIQQG